MVKEVPDEEWQTPEPDQPLEEWIEEVAAELPAEEARGVLSAEAKRAERDALAAGAKNRRLDRYWKRGDRWAWAAVYVAVAAYVAVCMWLAVRR